MTDVIEGLAMSLKRLLWVCGACVGFLMGFGVGLLLYGHSLGWINVGLAVALGIFHWLVLLPNNKPPQ